MEGKEVIADTAIYHCQQCGEKALKAYLALKNKPERIYNFVKKKINGLNRDKLIEDKENTEWK